MMRAVRSTLLFGQPDRLRPTVPPGARGVADPLIFVCYGGSFFQGSQPEGLAIASHGNAGFAQRERRWAIIPDSARSVRRVPEFRMATAQGFACLGE